MLASVLIRAVLPQPESPSTTNFPCFKINFSFCAGSGNGNFDRVVINVAKVVGSILGGLDDAEIYYSSGGVY